MADVAFAFHWSPEVMRAMTPGELMDWHKRARVRIKAAYCLEGK